MFREVQAEIARRNSKSAANQRKHRRGRYNSKYALSERLVCGNCGSPYKRVTWNIHGRKQMYEEQMAEACARTARSSGFDGVDVSYRSARA